MTTLSRLDVQGRVDQAGDFLRQRTRGLPVSPDDVVAAAEEFGLPVGTDTAQDPVARAIFIAGFAREARQVLEACYDLAWGRLQEYAHALA